VLNNECYDAGDEGYLNAEGNIMSHHESSENNEKKKSKFIRKATSDEISFLKSKARGNTTPEAN
jgi:hypothetical protein